MGVETMSRGQFEQVHERIWRVPSPYEGGGVTNVYIVRGAKTALVDTGVVGTPTHDVTPALAALGLSLSDVDLVANTHGHMDHLGGNAELKDVGAEIALHQADVPRAESNAFHAEQLRGMFQAIGMERFAAAREAVVLRLLGREVGVDRVLDDGDVLDLGADVRLTVVHTPGHTGGSVCYWWEAAGLLITGDSVQARRLNPGGVPIIEDPARYGASMERARDLGVNTLLMGHAFLGASGPLGPVARGERVAEVFHESLATHQALTRAFAEAVQAVPGGDGGEIARRAVAAAQAELGLENEAETGLPPGYIRTLPSYLRAARPRG